MLGNRITRPCKIHLTTVDTNERDAMGDPIANTDSGASTVCELQQYTAEEYRNGWELDVSYFNLFLLPGEVLDGWSELTIAPADVVSADLWDGKGDRYTLDGEPNPIRHPRTGVVHHIEATVRKVS